MSDNELAEKGRKRETCEIQQQVFAKNNVHQPLNQTRAGYVRIPWQVLPRPPPSAVLIAHSSWSSITIRQTSNPLVFPNNINDKEGIPLRRNFDGAIKP